MAWLPRRARRNALGVAAVGYARRGWFVVPGAYLVKDPRSAGRHARSRRDTRPPRCSCNLPICPAPGEHPASSDWQVQATHEPQTVAWWWSGRDIPNVILPTGWAFDAIHVPSGLGTRVLGRFQDPHSRIPVGPVARAVSGDWWFYVAAALDDDQPWLDRLARLGARHLGIGGYVLAPPSTGGIAGAVGWVVPPSASTVRLPSVEQFFALARGSAARGFEQEQHELRAGPDWRSERSGTYEAPHEGPHESSGQRPQPDSEQGPP